MNANMKAYSEYEKIKLETKSCSAPTIKFSDLHGDTLPL